MNLSSDEARIFAENIVDTIREALIVLNEKLQVIWASRSFYEQFKVVREQTEGRLIYELGNRQWNIPQLRQLLESIIPELTTIEDFEVRHHFEGIGERVMLLNARRVQREGGERGESVVILLAIEDVTKSKLLSRNLEEERDFINAVIQTSGALIAVIDKGGKITRFNKACEDLTGYSAEEVIGRGVFDLFILPEERDEVIRVAARLFSGEKTVEYENHWVARSGEKHFIRWRNTILQNKNKQPVYAVATGIDISDRKTAEKVIRNALEKAEAGDRLLTALMDNVPEGITIADTDGNLHKISKYGRELLGGVQSGMRIEDVVKRWQVFYADGQTIMPDKELPLVRALNGEIVRNVEIVEVNSDGRKLPLLSNAAPIRADGKVVGGIIVWRDISEQKKTEDALRESENRFRGIFDNAALGIVQVDTRDRFVAVNSFVCHMLGYSKEELLSLDVHHLTAPEDRAVSDEMNEKIHRKEVNRVVYEKRYLKADGSKIWVNVTVSSIRDEHDRHTGSVTIVEDISERKKVEFALRESEAGLKRAQKIAHLGSWELDLVTNRLTWSDEIYRIFGLKPQEFGATYEAFLSYVHPDDRDAVDAAYSTSVREGKDSYEIEHRVVRKDTGEIRFVYEKCQNIRGTSGEVVRSLGMIHDITERTQSEAALRRERTLLQTIYDSIPVMISIYDPAMKDIYLNKAFERITGWTRGETHNINVMELVYPDPEYRKEVSAFMESLAPGFKDITMVTKSGKAIETSWANIELWDGRRVGIGIDITKRKRLEEQIRQKVALLENANRDLERFNRIAVGRELRMIELKREVNALCDRFGEPRRYSLEFTDEEGK